MMDVHAHKQRLKREKREGMWREMQESSETLVEEKETPGELDEQSLFGENTNIESDLPNHNGTKPTENKPQTQPLLQNDLNPTNGRKVEQTSTNDSDQDQMTNSVRDSNTSDQQNARYSMATRENDTGSGELSTTGKDRDQQSFDHSDRISHSAKTGTSLHNNAEKQGQATFGKNNDDLFELNEESSGCVDEQESEVTWASGCQDCEEEGMTTDSEDRRSAREVRAAVLEMRKQPHLDPAPRRRMRRKTLAAGGKGVPVRKRGFYVDEVEETIDREEAILRKSRSGATSTTEVRQLDAENQIICVVTSFPPTPEIRQTMANPDPAQPRKGRKPSTGLLPSLPSISEDESDMSETRTSMSFERKESIVCPSIPEQSQLEEKSAAREEPGTNEEEGNHHEPVQLPAINGVADTENYNKQEPPTSLTQPEARLSPQQFDRLVVEADQERPGVIVEATEATGRKQKPRKRHYLKNSKAKEQEKDDSNQREIQDEEVCQHLIACFQNLLFRAKVYFMPAFICGQTEKLTRKHKEFFVPAGARVPAGRDRARRAGRVALQAQRVRASERPTRTPAPPPHPGRAERRAAPAGEARLVLRTDEGERQAPAVVLHLEGAGSLLRGRGVLRSLLRCDFAGLQNQITFAFRRVKRS